MRRSKAARRHGGCPDEDYRGEHPIGAVALLPTEHLRRSGPRPVPIAAVGRRHGGSARLAPRYATGVAAGVASDSTRMRVARTVPRPAPIGLPLSLTISSTNVPA